MYAFRLRDPIVFVDLMEHKINNQQNYSIDNLKIISTIPEQSKRRLIHIDHIKAVVFFAKHVCIGVPETLKAVVHVADSY